MARSGASSEKRQAVRVIPVQVTKQNRAAERRVSEYPIEIRQTRAPVEDKARSGAVMRQRNAGCVTPVTHVRLARRRGRSSHAAEEQFHPVARRSRDWWPDRIRARQPALRLSQDRRPVRPR